MIPSVKMGELLSALLGREPAEGIEREFDAEFQKLKQPVVPSDPLIAILNRIIRIACVFSEGRSASLDPDFITSSQAAMVVQLTLLSEHWIEYVKLSEEREELVRENGPSQSKWGDTALMRADMVFMSRVQYFSSYTELKGAIKDEVGFLVAGGHKGVEFLSMVSILFNLTTKDQKKQAIGEGRLIEIIEEVQYEAGSFEFSERVTC